MRYEAAALMNVDCLQRTGTQILEFVPRVGREDEDLASRRFDRLVADGEQRAATADHECLGVRVFVQARSPTDTLDEVGDDTDRGAARRALPFAVESDGIVEPLRGLRDRGHDAVQGLKSLTPVDSKSRTFRVTTVMSCTRPVAAM